MAYTIDLAKYPESMKGTLGKITDKAGKIHKCRGTSAVVHEIIVKGGGKTCSIFVREANLYFVGFKNANGTYCMKGDEEYVDGATALTIGCSYQANDGIGILRGNDVKNVDRNKGSLDNAVRVLAAYNGGAADAALKLAIGLIVYIVCEAFRFKTIFVKMEAIMKGGTFKIADFEELVTNWDNISTGGGDWAAKQEHLATKK